LSILITITYDNNPFVTGLETAWGFSCFIEGLEKTVLFDTGSNPFLLLRNIKRLKINPDDIDLIFVSHMHWDHTGGLYGIVEKNTAVTVFLPGSFSRRYKEDIKRQGAKIVETKELFRLCKGVFSTGELGTSIKEQSLIIHTNRGLIVITGCAHPGILEVLNKAKDLMNDDILLVMGGYHLGGKGRDELEKIVSSFKKLGVRYVGPCHCTGDAAGEVLKEEYQKNFINVGVGKVITMEDLK
jgi:7,8-dihydropterin-6-yl-methyl-4-(beta-D-ribofuranosyl)aminobenzene 5'-phosphate synthase